MKEELLVIVYKYETVNLEPNLAHTARHAMEAGFMLNSLFYSKLLKKNNLVYLFVLIISFIFLGVSA